MKIYTKKGDNGRTSLLRGQGVLKTDDRIELLGTIDELNSHIGLAKVISGEQLREQLIEVQQTLMKISAGVADPNKRDYRMTDEEIEKLEHRIDGMDESLGEWKGFVLYGGCELSARLDVARAVARRAERRFHTVAQRHVADKRAMKYMNRLSDYLYTCARFADHQAEVNRAEGIRQEVIKDILKNETGR